MSKYEDITHLTRPQYPDLPPMSIHDRAAQFSPFAALVGYDDAVAETARLTYSRREISEEELNELNVQLGKLAELISSKPQIRVTYFIPVSRKDGGSYSSRTGNAKSIDQIRNTIKFTDGDEIPIADIYSIVFL